jgi:hypothetical protein
MRAGARGLSRRDDFRGAGEKSAAASLILLQVVI